MHAWTREYLSQFEFLATNEGIEDLLNVSDDVAIKLGNGNTGLSLGKFKFLLNSHPDLPSVSTVTDSEKSSGNADKIEEDIQHVSGKSIEFPLPDLSSPKFLWFSIKNLTLLISLYNLFIFYLLYKYSYKLFKFSNM